MHGVQSVTDLMVRPGIINLDFADVETVMASMGKAMMGTGEAEGDGRAMKATEIFAYYLKSLNKKIILTSKTMDFADKNLNLWLPTKILSHEPKFEKSWESTSDSIATWLYSNTKSNGLIFIKSIN